MLINNEENFVFFPASNENQESVMHYLAPVNAIAEHCFVMIPYQNPQIARLNPQFYSIQKSISFTPEISTEKNDAQKLLTLQSRTSREKYIENVKKLKTHIQQGNIYEINYCIEFFAENVELNYWSIFAKLLKLTKAPYSCLLKLGSSIILCASPELYLKKEGARLITKPIKGTIRRGKNKEEDASLKETLHNSLKERTENVMAVDVARNDLSVFAAKGSVNVNKLYNIETFETVHQMVSTVDCIIPENVTFSNILDATFPMASMTGAPKLRAMTLIDEVEDFERGFYSGAMGIIKNGDYTLAVNIRCIYYDLKTKKLSIKVGGAITYLSDPEKEYEECLLKAKGLLQALNASII